MKPSFRDVHLSAALQGVSATASEGVCVYRVFVAAEALLELGATKDSTTWVPAFYEHEARIAARATAVRRNAPEGTAIIEAIEAPDV